MNFLNSMIQTHQSTTTRQPHYRRHRRKVEQAKDIYRLHFDHGMGYEQIADKYQTTRVVISNAIIAHKRELQKEGKWYPRKHAVDVIGKIMREAYEEKFSPKQIAHYFKISVGSVYNKLNLRGRKGLKKMQKELEGKDNIQ